MALRDDVGSFAVGEGPKAWNVLQTEPRFARYREYWANLKARDSVKQTFDEVRRYHVTDFFICSYLLQENLRKDYASRFGDQRRKA